MTPKSICLAIISLIIMTACSQLHEPLFHTGSVATIQLNLHLHTNIDDLWPQGWQSRWQVEWDTTRRGPMGYSEPETYHTDIFRTQGNIYSGSRNIVGNHTQLALESDIYDMTFYNNDFQGMELEDTPAKGFVAISSEADHKNTLPDSLHINGQLTYMPEQLFATKEVTITLGKDAATSTFNTQTGRYEQSIDEMLEPLTFIYMLQVELKDSLNHIRGCAGCIIDGLVASDTLINNPTGTRAEIVYGTAAHQVPVFFQEQTRADGTKQSYIGGRLLTFGQSTKPNTCSILLQYKNGGQRYVQADITSQLATQPTGGILNIYLNTDTIAPPSPGASGGGMQVDVGDWNVENHIMHI